MKELLQSIHTQFSNIPLQTITLIVSFVVTCILGFITIPILRKLKIGQVVRDDGPQSHLKKTGTPTMGGIIILITSVVCLRFVVGTSAYHDGRSFDMVVGSITSVRWSDGDFRHADDCEF